MTVLSLANGEKPSSLSDMNFSVFMLLVISCLVGAAIGFSSWWCRGLLSATSFTIVGVANKFLSILLNIVVWDKVRKQNTLALCSFSIINWLTPNAARNTPRNVSSARVSSRRHTLQTSSDEG